MQYAEGDIHSTAKGSGARANSGKVQFSLIPMHLLAGTARVLMSGQVKYASWNWAKGMKWSTCVDCLFRHLFKWWFCGEDIDPESGEHHLDHVICNALFLKHYLSAYPEGDDRPPEHIGFAGSLPDVNRPFDLDAFLDRNPDVRELIERRKQEEESRKDAERDKIFARMQYDFGREQAERDRLSRRKQEQSKQEAAVQVKFMLKQAERDDNILTRLRDESTRQQPKEVDHE